MSRLPSTFPNQVSPVCSKWIRKQKTRKPSAPQNPLGCSSQVWQKIRSQCYRVTKEWMWHMTSIFKIQGVWRVTGPKGDDDNDLDMRMHIVDQTIVLNQDIHSPNSVEHFKRFGNTLSAKTGSSFQDFTRRFVFVHPLQKFFNEQHSRMIH